MVKIFGAENLPFYYGATPEIMRLAGDLRKRMTPAEKLLWEQLRKRKVAGFEFRRQHPCSSVILDFYCHTARLSIEIDGDVHLDSFQKERDRERSKILRDLGIREIRFTNHQIEFHLNAVLDQIYQSLLKTLPPCRGKGRDGG